MAPRQLGEAGPPRLRKAAPGRKGNARFHRKECECGDQWQVSVP